MEDFEKIKELIQSDDDMNWILGVELSKHLTLNDEQVNVLFSIIASKDIKGGINDVIDFYHKTGIIIISQSSTDEYIRISKLIIELLHELNELK